MTWIDELRNRKGSNNVDEALTLTPERYTTEAAGDREYALWLYLLDAGLRRRIGFTHNDLADRDWREHYETGDSPYLAARQAFRDEYPGGES